MAKLARIEDRPTPPEVYSWRVYFNAFVATFAAVMIGYDSAFIGTSISLDSFKEEFGLNEKSATELNTINANIVSMYQAGCFFGAIFGYPIGYFLGRKFGLVLAGAVFVLGAALQTGASSSTGLGIIYGGRVVVGLAIGAASNLAPIYVAEIAPPAIRGRLIGMYELCWQIGGVVGFWINYGVTEHIGPSHKQWLVAFAVQLVPGGLLFLGSFLIVESPRFLITRDRNGDALRNLSYLRNLPSDAPYIVQEFSEMEAAVAHERSLAGAGFLGPIRTVFADRKLIQRLLLGVSLFMWQNATGINAINYYSPTIFKSIGISGSNTSLLTTGVYGIIKLVCAMAWLLYLVDQLGRRPLLMIGASGGAVSMYYIAAYIAIANPSGSSGGSVDAGGRSAVAAFYIWTLFYSPTWNGTPWVIGAEMFPQHVRTFTQACMAASNWLFTFLVARFTPQMFAAMDYGVYLFFASLMVCSVVFIFFLLPETKQVPLEMMDELFASDVRPWNAHAKVIARMKDHMQAAEVGQMVRGPSMEVKSEEERKEVV
ncbi:MFS quinate transporter QutD [Mucidula mucida]|nr:MFS quinate transporter QutD [Mucidula mucida]